MDRSNKGSKKGISRRKFLKGAGIGVSGTMALLYFGRSVIRRGLSGFVAEMDMPSGISDFGPHLWFEVNVDNTITLKSPKVEMGQGIFTGFAMLAAEELDIDLDKIKVVHATSANGILGNTGVSNSTSSLYVNIREVAATLRETLKLEASKLWGVGPDSIETKAGVLYGAGKEVTYAGLAKQTSKWETAETPALRPASAFKYVGKEFNRIDLPDKVLGKPIYGIDTTLPNMVYGAVMYSPYIGGKLKNADLSRAESAVGVLKVVQDKDWIGIVAGTRYAAEEALAKVKAAWEYNPNYNTKDAIEAVTVGIGTEVNIQKEGSTGRVQSEEVKSEYRTPIGFHAGMEPSIVVADVVDDKVTIYTSHQHLPFMQQSISDRLGFSSKNIVMVPVFLGGGFGRRTFKHNAVEAVKLSQAVGKPVHLLYNRQQEFQNGFVRPNTHHVLSGKLTDDGKILGMQHDFASGPMGFMAMPKFVEPILGADFVVAGHGARIRYAIENLKTTMWQSSLPFETCMWRGVGMFANTFAIESFMDELAHKSGVNPLKFRLDHCGDTKQLNRRKKLLELIGEKSGWYRPIAEDVGRGVAVCDDHKTIAAAVVELKIEEGKIVITKVYQAIDPGVIINPAGIRQQVEGATMMAISASLHEQGTIENGRFVETNFHNYKVATLKDTPEIEVIMYEGSDKPSGVGEPPISPIAPAIANAVFDLTGKRLRTLPLQVALENENNSM
ncbi:isoquinoline 1-oxidoreductase beta subunit [Algoriphagus sp. 4150]|uniref:xanthine dehydrogenase family protein molybdopterin-binding subunit n=1 Tax=Algoriphagus sp. 4150 TaxID=2817756 RepID=UPI0028631279|nr:molybdopterin cofactor-binding domain-containing protein [Algoriphagus sp. 4150]MDR7131843.1 isoquinoline 1-oxidoreductase beta subunit [Algoriphagus sp. 4150]